MRLKTKRPTTATTTALTVAEDKIANVSNLVKTLTITQNLENLKIKLLLIIIMINILLLKNLIIWHQKSYCKQLSKFIKQKWYC